MEMPLLQLHAQRSKEQKEEQTEGSLWTVDPMRSMWDRFHEFRESENPQARQGTEPVSDGSNLGN
jgi:hypothetical protein